MPSSSNHLPTDRIAIRKLSLTPLDLETALKAALEVEPPAEPVRKGRVKKEKPAQQAQ